jgi:hypothetical protein
MSGSTSRPPYATPPLGVNGAPIMEFIQPLPQPILQLTSGVGSTETTTTTTTGGLASLDTSQGAFVLPVDFA